MKDSGIRTQRVLVSLGALGFCEGIERVDALVRVVVNKVGLACHLIAGGVEDVEMPHLVDHATGREETTAMVAIELLEVEEAGVFRDGSLPKGISPRWVMVCTKFVETIGENEM